MKKIPLKIYIKEKELKKKTKANNKIKTFFLLMIAYVVAIFEYLFSYKNKNNNQQLEKVLKEERLSKTDYKVIYTFLEEKEASSKIRSLVKTEKEKVLEIEKKVTRQLKILKSTFHEDEEIKDLEKHLMIVEQIKKNDVEITIKEEKSASIELPNQRLETEEIANEKADESLLDIKIVETPKIVGIPVPEQKKDYTLELKKDKDVIKEYIVKLELIEEKIQKTKNYNDLYEYEYNIKVIFLKLKELETKFKTYKDDPEYKTIIEKLRKVEKYKYVTDKKSFDLLLNRCEIDLVKIEEKRHSLLSDEIIIDNKPKQEEKKNPEKKEEVFEEKIEKKQEEIPEKIKSIELIREKIKKQNQVLEKIKQENNSLPPEKKKKTIFERIKRIATNTLDFGFSLLPIKLFENKILGTLTSFILLNIKVRNMRKVLNEEDKFDEDYYEEILSKIDNGQETIYDVKYSCFDSLNELSLFEEEFNLKYQNSKEKEDVNEKIDNLKIILESKIKSIDEIDNDLVKKKEKAKQKVLNWK